MRVLPQFPIAGWEPLGIPACHGNTLSNELGCLHNRVLMRVPRAQPEALSALRIYSRQVIEHLRGMVGGPVMCWSRAKAAASLISRHGPGRYGPAAASLRARALTEQDSLVKLFLKAEKWERMEGTTLKTARAIQYRTPRYNIELARFLLPLEELLWQALHIQNPLRWYSTKNLDWDRRAQLVEALWEKHPHAVALCLDHSRFDAHVSKEVLRVEHEVYQALCEGDRHFLAWMLRQQLVNRGRAGNGTKYVCPGGRMSGDINTALGNTIINAMVLGYAVGGCDVDLLVEGDDAVIIGEATVVLALRETVIARARTLGFELEVEAVAYSLEEIRFCSAAVLGAAGGGSTRMCRDWHKPIVTDPWTTAVVPTEELARARALGMALCFGVLYQGIPIYEEWAHYLLSHVPRLRAKGGFGWCELTPHFDRRDAWYERAIQVGRAASPRRITPEVRAAFAVATSIPPSEQSSVEARLAAQRGPWPAWSEAEARKWLEKTPSHSW